MRETELLHGPQPLLAVYSLLVHVRRSLHKFMKGTLNSAATISFKNFLYISSASRTSTSLRPSKPRETPTCVSTSYINGMIKAKSQLSEMVKSLEDETGAFERFQEIIQKARSNKAASQLDKALNQFEAILEYHKRQGEEDNSLKRRMKDKKAVAKKKASRESSRKKMERPDQRELVQDLNRNRTLSPKSPTRMI
ncbi:hypothetical protein CONPUDRAFT_156760 [Coniophora puteana RWD-64-598 SS2]|uniref:Uncharacterized protein n=1 Tax=Coniophora puteana (strain RWD-64-598) TaxID=741705 RepID=A0A5M3MG16_CONPW|nr:uncharacterized protein CONPUDRAFT_156760 [Coniophora puteana RWD-64-598 SS2]EIW77541.1 hypothetical protein CONPUDRAFT_156760 [Coniophora puteana RWD-64-598 SS2]